MIDDPAELWERYLDEVPDEAARSPQGAIAFAFEAMQPSWSYSYEDFMALAARLRRVVASMNNDDKSNRIFAVMDAAEMCERLAME